MIRDSVLNFPLLSTDGQDFFLLSDWWGKFKLGSFNREITQGRLDRVDLERLLEKLERKTQGRFKLMMMKLLSMIFILIFYIAAPILFFLCLFGVITEQELWPELGLFFMIFLGCLLLHFLRRCEHRLKVENAKRYQEIIDSKEEQDIRRKGVRLFVSPDCKFIIVRMVDNCEVSFDPEQPYSSNLLVKPYSSDLFY